MLFFLFAITAKFVPKVQPQAAPGRALNSMTLVNHKCHYNIHFLVRRGRCLWSSIEGRVGLRIFPGNHPYQSTRSSPQPILVDKRNETWSGWIVDRRRTPTLRPCACRGPCGCLPTRRSKPQCHRCQLAPRRFRCNPRNRLLWYRDPRRENQRVKKWKMALHIHNPSLNFCIMT